VPPLQLNDEEMTVLLTLARPIDHQLRPQFLQEVATELEAERQAGEIGGGAVHLSDRRSDRTRLLYGSNCGSRRLQPEHAP